VFTDPSSRHGARGRSRGWPAAASRKRRSPEARRIQKLERELKRKRCMLLALTGGLFDVVRAQVPKIKLNDVFEKKEDIANILTNNALLYKMAPISP
jgi:hypothetical protein